MKANAERHGHRKSDANGGRSPTYISWEGMIQRCRDPNCNTWPAYGGRGIKVCDRWLRFDEFLADMGKRPRGRTLDRIDNAGNYEPGNCRWATLVEQQSNMRNNRLVACRGKTQTIAQWARESGRFHQTINRRLKAGWPVEEAIFGPSQQGTRKWAKRS